MRWIPVPTRDWRGNVIGFGLVIFINRYDNDRQASAGHQRFGTAARLMVVAVHYRWASDVLNSHGQYRPQNDTECGGEDWMQGGV